MYLNDIERVNSMTENDKIEQREIINVLKRKIDDCCDEIEKNIIEHHGIGAFSKMNFKNMSGASEIEMSYYLMSYGMAYAFEYAVMYSIALNVLKNSPKIGVVSFGCGSQLDALSLLYSSKFYSIDKNNISYFGMDICDWAKKFDIQGRFGHSEFIQDSIENFFDGNEKYKECNIFMFGNLLNEIDDDEIIKKFCEKLEEKFIDYPHDEFVMCVLYSGNYLGDDEKGRSNRKALRRGKDISRVLHKYAKGFNTIRDIYYQKNLSFEKVVKFDGKDNKVNWIKFIPELCGDCDVNFTHNDNAYELFRDAKAEYGDKNIKYPIKNTKSMRFKVIRFTKKGVSQ